MSWASPQAGHLQAIAGDCRPSYSIPACCLPPLFPCQCISMCGGGRPVCWKAVKVIREIVLLQVAVAVAAASQAAAHVWPDFYNCCRAPSSFIFYLDFDIHLDHFDWSTAPQGVDRQFTSALCIGTEDSVSGSHSLMLFEIHTDLDLFSAGRIFCQQPQLTFTIFCTRQRAQF